MQGKKSNSFKINNGGTFIFYIRKVLIDLGTECLMMKWNVHQRKKKLLSVERWGDRDRGCKKKQYVLYLEHCWTIGQSLNQI